MKPPFTGVTQEDVGVAISAFSEADERAQTVDERRPLVTREAWTGGIDQGRQFLPVGPALADLVRPHDDLGRCARAGRALVDNFAGKLDDLIDRSSRGCHIN